MWLRTRPLLLVIVLCTYLCTVSAKISDKRLCADPKCEGKWKILSLTFTFLFSSIQLTLSPLLFSPNQRRRDQPQVHVPLQ